MSQITNLEKFYINKCIIKIENNDKLKEIDTTNCMSYYLDDIIKIEDFDLDNIIIDEKSCENIENILLYNISYKSLIDSKPFHIGYSKTEGFIRWN